MGEPYLLFRVGSQTIIPKHDTPETWEANNPVLMPDEIGYDGVGLKIGDRLAPYETGRTWNELPYSFLVVREKESG